MIVRVLVSSAVNAVFCIVQSQMSVPFLRVSVVGVLTSALVPVPTVKVIAPVPSGAPASP